MFHEHQTFISPGRVLTPSSPPSRFGAPGRQQCWCHRPGMNVVLPKDLPKAEFGESALWSWVPQTQPTRESILGSMTESSE